MTKLWFGGVLAGLLMAPLGAGAQEAPAECRVLVAKEWIAMGATTLTGCFQFAEEAASPGERQFAKLGDNYLKVQDGERLRSHDGGNTWESIAAPAPAGAFNSLNVLHAPSGEIREVTEAVPKTTVKKKKKKRKKRRPAQSR